MNNPTDPLKQLKAGKLVGQTELKISANLSEFPLEILTLAESLELLVLSGNQLSELPEAFAQLTKLKVVFFNNNAFETFPSVLAKCPNLAMVSFKGNKIREIKAGQLSPAIRWLILTNNQLTDLPADIGQLTKLQKLMLAGNQLQTLPAEMANCQNLELIRLSANRLKVLPPWLCSLPRLSWLAYAGNPCCDTEAMVAKRTKLESALPTIPKAELALGEVLGQGASGIIYKAVWNKDSKAQDVAVKLFKGEMTSDGLPLDEMRACMGAGHHPNLVNVLGQASGFEQAGLVFSFIGADYINLGGPPSLESCTRDTYCEETMFTLPVVFKIISGIASAVAHLHTSGIIHGDLYAHNILINEQGESLLGDFGAASFYKRDDQSLSNALERLETRAFGCLLEDLLDRCKIVAGDSFSKTGFEALQNLQHRCMAMPEARPLFTEICEKLADVAPAGWGGSAP